MRGFSLIEVLIYLFILSLLILVVTPQSYEILRKIEYKIQLAERKYEQQKIEIENFFKDRNNEK